MSERSFQRSVAVISMIGFSAVAFIAFTNNSIMAVDDYLFIIQKMIPAQQMSFQKIVDIAATDFYHTSLVPQFFALSLTKLALLCGVEEPLGQLAIARTLWGILNWIVTIWVLIKMLQIANIDTARNRLTTLLLMSLYIPIALLYSRFMIETMSIPFVLGFILCAQRYNDQGSYRDLCLAVLFLSIGAMIRMQVGLLLPVLFFITLRRKSASHLICFILTGVAFFLLTGLFDQYFFGKFHKTLLGYLSYNIAHSSDHGKVGPMAYVALLVGLTLPPTFFYRWSTSLKKELQKLWIPICCVVLFVGAHSLVPHKEERFIIPILPVFFLIMALVISDLVRHKRYIRITYFTFVSIAMLLLGSSTTIQNNVVAMCQFLERNTDIKELYFYEEKPLIFPDAYLSRPIRVGTISKSDLALPETCSAIVAVLEPARADFEAREQGRYTHIATFHPQMLEKIAIRINPEQNERRRSFLVYKRRACKNQLVTEAQ